MRKKLIIPILLISALLAVALVRQQAGPAPLAAKAPPVVPVAPPPAAPPVQAEAESEPQDEMPEPELRQALKGRDFKLRVLSNGNDIYSDLEVEMDSGEPVKLLRSLEGHTGELSNSTFDANDDFELVEMIPGEAREQIVCESAQMLPRGQGVLNTYTLYRIEGDHLQELFSVLLKRDREADNGWPAQKLDARLEPTTQDGQPAFLYHVKVGKGPERTILFRWNGNVFQDTSGAYEKIAEENSP